MPKPKKSAAISRKSSKSGSAASASGFPSIDTNLAAESAAKMLLRKPSAPASPADSKKQSGAFKNMKESINKPNLGGLDQIMGSTGPQRSNLPHHRDQQKGHNQTFSADANRAGLPRRTPG